MKNPNSLPSLGKAIPGKSLSPSRKRSRRISDLSFGNSSKASGPRNYRPLASIGPGVFELRDQDERTWYRVVYLSRIEDVIYVLHCFEKKSREMPKKDFQKARQRFKAVKSRLAEEKNREKRIE
jgi:phage-related protein